MEPRRTAALLLLLLLLLSTPLPSDAQTYSQPYDDAPYNPRLNSTVAVIIVVLICVFFSMVFFSLYLRRCTDARAGVGTSRLLPSGLASRSRRSRRRGLDKAVVDSFPMMVYSEVKELKLGKGTLECAVCLSEFDDTETLRLLPRCNHAFHPDCIGMWLDSHATCPVCRADLAAPPPAHVVVPVDEGAAGQEEAAVADEGDRAWTEEERERFTLRLPVGVREEVMAKRLNRSATLAVAGRALSKGSKGGWSFKREWAAKSDRWAVMGRSWSLRTLRGGRQAEGFGVGRDEGETSAAADQRV